jgi:hypothetical protein
MTRYLAIDPGGTTGYAWMEDGLPVEIGEVPLAALKDWLDKQEPEFFVVETYIIRPQGAGGFNHSWNKGETLQIIGAIKLHAASIGVKVYEQQSSIKKVAAGMFNLPNKGSHQMDAVLHGRYWWFRNVTNKGRTVRRGQKRA